MCGLSIGLLELRGTGPPAEPYAPAVTPDGRYHLWMAGEAFDGGGFVEVPDADGSRTLAFRRSLLANLLDRGVDAIATLDGEYQIALWDTRDRRLVLLNDRFGGLPLYWARSRAGFAFAGGVRGILMAPGIRCDPDPEAIREAVTFGGFRLGDRTSVAAVKMVAGASVVTVDDGRPTFRRYWRWTDVPASSLRPIDGLIDEAQRLWRRAIRLRLSGATRPGQTLSGGLDSRAILAEAAPVAPTWTAITYGLAGCDDARYAKRAVEAVGATWVFQPLYGGRDHDWLDVRTGQVQHTDGLIDLTDLMHLEALPLQVALLDVHLSGYIGDAVSGPTFNDVITPGGALRQLPFYGTRLGLDEDAALARVEQCVSTLDGARAVAARAQAVRRLRGLRFLARPRLGASRATPPVRALAPFAIPGVLREDPQPEDRLARPRAVLARRARSRPTPRVADDPAILGRAGFPGSPAAALLSRRRRVLARPPDAGAHRGDDRAPGIAVLRGPRPGARHGGGVGLVRPPGRSHAGHRRPLRVRGVSPGPAPSPWSCSMRTAR